MTSAVAPAKGEYNTPRSEQSGLGLATRQELVERARRIAPLITAEAEKTESGRTLSRAGIDALRESELFWCAVPCEVGGLGCDLSTAIEIMEEITRADGSSGWTLMANLLATALAGAYLQDKAVDEIFGGQNRPIIAGMFGPGGKARQVTGGFQGGGKYSFGSGSNHADWLGGGMFVMADGAPRMLPSGAPEVRIGFVPRERVRFAGNWDVMGLEGTGSYDYEFPDQFIPDDFTMERSQQIQLRGGPHFALGLQAFGCAGHAAVALGLMRRALAEIARIALTKKRPGASVTVSESAVFKHDFSIQDANYHAARAYVFEVFATAEAAARRGESADVAQRHRIRQVTTWAHKVAAEVVGFCHLWGGSDSIRNPSALGRCTRDVNVATQHVFVDHSTLVDAAPALLGHWAAAAQD
ncbi:MAG: Pigment production hydroxylase [Gammaproteobacteria bacterium]|jgi:alkylation response protein AidB-like acyl-CoA dehydrogenase|nr:Pigment production hydroxylase [Gammaproteobacteria bacterium]